MKTHPEMLAERMRKQASISSFSPEQLLLEELLDMTRAYMVALEILSKESRNENSPSR